MLPNLSGDSAQPDPVGREIFVSPCPALVEDVKSMVEHTFVSFTFEITWNIVYISPQNMIFLVSNKIFM